MSNDTQWNITPLALSKEQCKSRANYQILHREKQQFRQARSTSPAPWKQMATLTKAFDGFQYSAKLGSILTEGWIITSKEDFTLFLNKQQNISPTDWQQASCPLKGPSSFNIIIHSHGNCSTSPPKIRYPLRKGKGRSLPRQWGVTFVAGGVCSLPVFSEVPKVSGLLCHKIP